jgi:trehalose/maltose hydrolase-like predicted phosphorylase
MDSGWRLAEDAFDINTNRGYEGLFTLGSGALHVRGSLEEHLRDAPQNLTYLRRPTNTTVEVFPDRKAKWGTYVPGVYGDHPLLLREMANLPWFLELIPEVGGERLDLETSQISAYRRELRLDTATLRRSLRWTTRSGAALELVFERFVSAARRRLCLQRLTVSADRPVTLRLRAGIDADVRTGGYDHFKQTAFSQPGAATIACRVTTDAGSEVQTVTRLLAPAERLTVHNEERRAWLLAEIPLVPGQPVTVEKRSAVATGHDPTDAAYRDPVVWLDALAGHDYEALHAEHAAIWRERWRETDVIIEGDEAAQLGLRVYLYHLMRAHPGDSRYSIEAKGYAGDAYRGSFFWDTEIYMLPFFLYSQPGRARELLDFRLQSLPGAQANATRYGYSGARYPWMSDSEGNETCSGWEYADHEVHVSADVVYALDHYARATGDDDYLRGPAAEVILETARCWLERIDWRRGEDHPSLLGVMGPDEYTPISDNNSFTNRMVNYALELAAQITPDADESAAFRRAAALPIPRSENDPRLVLQCEGFERLADLDFDRFWPDRGRGIAAQVSQERLYRSKALKQADVLLLMALFPHEFEDDEIRAAWEYYLPLTSHDSSLSAGVHALIALRLGMMPTALDFWRQSLEIDLDIESGGASNGMHIAAAGILWQIAVLGFGGLLPATQSDMLALAPELPPEWTRLAFPVCWRGRRYAVDIHQDAAGTVSVEIDLREGEAGAVRVYGLWQRIQPGRPEVFVKERTEI